MPKGEALNLPVCFPTLGHELWEKPAEVDWASLLDTSWTPPWGCSRHVLLGGGPGKTQDMLEILCLLGGLGMPWDPNGRAGENVQGEGSLGFYADCCPL